MSWEAVTWANRQKLKKSFEQIVLLVLANVADPNGEAFAKWPGRDHWWTYLSEKTRLPKSSLFRHLNTLVALGLGERTMQVLADGTRRPTFKLNLTAAFDIDLPEDQQRYLAAFAKTSSENQSPVGTEDVDELDHIENDSDISNSQGGETPIAPQSPVETGLSQSQSPMGTEPVPVLGLHKDSKSCSKDSPLPPSGGASARDELWEEFVRSWGEPIQRMVLALAAWDRTATDKRPKLVAAAKGLWAWRRSQAKPKEAPSAQNFVRDEIGWEQWLRYAPGADSAAPKIAHSYALNSPEGRAIVLLHEIVGRTSAFAFLVKGGMISFPGRVITPQLLALGRDDVPPREVVLDRRGGGSWEEFVSQFFEPGDARQRMREGSRAPWPFAPGKDGRIYPTGPPAVNERAG